MDTKKIGAFIALNRKAKGFTQEQLAEKLGVSNKTISRWENGNYMPDLSLLVPLSKILGISLNELLAGENIDEDHVIAYSEDNLAKTLDYSVQKMRQDYKRVSVYIMTVGVFLFFFSFSILPIDNDQKILYSLMGLILFGFGMIRELKYSLTIKYIRVCFGVCLVFLSMSLFGFANISSYGRAEKFVVGEPAKYIGQHGKCWEINSEQICSWKDYVYYEVDVYS